VAQAQNSEFKPQYRERKKEEKKERKKEKKRETRGIRWPKAKFVLKKKPAPSLQ
jgi:hypothetical protein